jgi:hypothetical protein
MKANTPLLRYLHLLLVALIISLNTNAEGGVLIKGPGAAISCGKWVELRGQGQPAWDAESWLMGYLSGAAEMNNVDVLRTTDSAAIFGWMDNFCKANPLQPFADGASRLFQMLGKRTAR